jgi:hypothetical protein
MGVLLLSWDTEVAWITLSAPLRSENFLAQHIVPIVKVHPVLVVYELTLFLPPVSLPQEKLSAAACTARQMKAGLEPSRTPLCTCFLHCFDTLLDVELKRLGKEIQGFPRIFKEQLSCR